MKDNKDFINKWSEEVREIMTKKANELLDYAKKNSDTYGELEGKLLRVMANMRYRRELYHLTALVEMAMEVVKEEKNGLSIKKSEGKEAPEVEAQELVEYIGKCEYCSKLNEISLFKDIVPKHCMECGKAIPYQSSPTL